MGPEDREMRVNLPATLEALEGVCAEFRRWRAEKCAFLDAFGAELLLREALTNSVVHGCANDPAQKLCCVLRVKRNRLLIAVTDTGVGFDWRAAWDRIADVSDPDGRGIEIFRGFASRVRFNEAGNAVTLMKRT